ncbi:MAG: murein biosynthesis integral membrane protein MurJ [Caldilineaceae bacterium]
MALKQRGKTDWQRGQRQFFQALFTREFSITEGSAILIASFFVSAVLGALRQVLFNAQFGVGVEANAYYAAFRLPDTLFSLIAGGTLSNAMIPVLIGTVRKDSEEAGYRLISLVFTSMMVVMSVIVLLLMLFTPLFVRYVLAPGFDAETAQLTITLTRIKLLQPFILSVGSVATAVLNSRNQFLLPAISIMTYNLTLIGGILLAGIYPPIGIYGPTFGTVVGAVFQIIILWPGLAVLRGRRWFTWDPGNRRLREVVYLLIPNGLSAVVNYGGAIIDTAFASLANRLVALPAVYNAVLLANLPVTLLGYAVGLAAFPRFAERAETGDWHAMRRLVLIVLAIACSLSFVAMATIYLVGRLVVHLLFEHGQFDAAAGDVTFSVLQVYALGLPVHVGTEILSRALISMRDTRTPLFTNIGQLISRATIMWLAIEPYGLFAIPMAFVSSSALETIVLALVLFYKLRTNCTTARDCPNIGLASIRKFSVPAGPQPNSGIGS